MSVPESRPTRAGLSVLARPSSPTLPGSPSYRLGYDSTKEKPLRLGLRLREETKNLRKPGQQPKPMRKGSVRRFYRAPSRGPSFSEHPNHNLKPSVIATSSPQRPMYG